MLFRVTNSYNNHILLVNGLVIFLWIAFAPLNRLAQAHMTKITVGQHEKIWLQV